MPCGVNVCACACACVYTCMVRVRLPACCRLRAALSYLQASLSFLVPSCYRVQPGDLQRGLCTSWQASFSSDLFSLEMT